MLWNFLVALRSNGLMNGAHVLQWMGGQIEIYKICLCELSDDNVRSAFILKCLEPALLTVFLFN